MDESYFPSSSMSLDAAKFISAHCDVFSVPGYLVPQLRVNGGSGTKIKEFSGSNFRSLLNKRKSPLRDDLMNITQYRDTRQRYNGETLISLVFDLLSFCLADLPHDSSDARYLKGIPLLPLARTIKTTSNMTKGGERTKIATFGMGQYIAASYKQQLLCPHFKQFVHPKCYEEPFVKWFSSPAFCHNVQLKPWSLEFVKNELPNVFKWSPRNFMEWKYDESLNEGFHSVASSPDAEGKEKEYDYQANHETVPHILPNGAPHPKWIQLFWENVPISDQKQGTIEHFGNWPLLPLTNHKLCAVKFAAKIALLPPDDKMESVADKELQQKLKAILVEMNYPIIDWRFFPSKDATQLLDKLSNIQRLTNNISSSRVAFAESCILWQNLKTLSFFPWDDSERELAYKFRN